MLSWRVCNFIRQHFRAVFRGYSGLGPVASSFRPFSHLHVQVRRLCRQRNASSPPASGSVLLLSSTSILSQVFLDAAQQEREELDVLHEIMYDQQEKMTGEERLNQMWTRDDSEWSPEVKMIKTTAYTAGFIGMMFGGSLVAARGAANFKERNIATKFETRAVANQRYYDRIFLGFVRGGLTVALRMALVAFAFQAVLLSLSVYYNEVRLSSYLLAGILVGLLARFNRGIVAMLASATACCFLSLLAGVLMTGVFAITGVSFTDLRHRIHHREYHRQKDRQKFMDEKLSCKLREGDV